MNDVQRNAIASVFLEWALDPHSAAHAHAFLFGTTPQTVTYDVVKATFGEHVADMWKAVQEAKKAYWEAVRNPVVPTSDVTETKTTNTKSTLLDPKKCIASGGRKRCMDCRCNLPSPPHTVNETWKDYC